MTTYKKSAKPGSPTRANAAPRPVAQQQAAIQRGPGGTLQRLATASPRVQVAAQRQALVQRKASVGAVAQLEPGYKVADSDVDAIKKKHAVNDDSQGVGFVFEGITYDGSIMLPTAANIEAKALLTGGLYVEDEGGAGVFWVTADMVNDYWEKGKIENGFNSNPGSYAPDKGYRRTNSGPNELVNCGAHAHGVGNWIEPDDMHVHLNNAQLYTPLTVDNIADMVANKVYVLSSKFHFIKVKKEGADEFLTSETNGGSAIYERTLTASGLKDLMQERKYGLHGRN